MDQEAARDVHDSKFHHFHAVFGNKLSNSRLANLAFVISAHLAEKSATDSKYFCLSTTDYLQSTYLLIKCENCWGWNGVGSVPNRQQRIFTLVTICSPRCADVKKTRRPGSMWFAMGRQIACLATVANPGSGRGGPNIFPEILPTKRSEPILAGVQGPP